MTDQELIDYYADLLIIQYRGKPRAYATIQALVDMPVMNQLPMLVQDAFTIGTAIGVQLDIIGKYVGVVRTGLNPDDGSAIILDDEEFTTLIQMAIVKNASGSSLATIQDLLFTYFAGTIQVFDFQTMRINYYIDSDATSQDLVIMFILQGLLPKPMGVAMAIIYAPIVDTFFGFCSYQAPTPVNNSPFNTYDDYEMDYPWLNYTDAFVI